MKNIKPMMLLVPFIVLIIVLIFYFIVLKKETDKILFKRFVLTTVLLSVILNFTWEILQMPLYKNNKLDFQHLVFCGLATVADTIMVLLIYFSYALIFKNALWIKKLDLKLSLLLMLTGGAGAILSEMRHLAEGNWAYADSIPLIPLVNAGLSPVLQFTLLPVIIYWAGFKFSKKLAEKIITAV